LSKGRTWQAPVEPDEFFDGVEFEISPRWMGQRIRKDEYHLEVGGPKHGYQSYIHVRAVKDPNEITDGRIELIGPEIDEVEPGSSFPFGILVKCYGSQLTDDHADPLLRYTFMAVEQGEGWMLLNARDTIWFRLSKESAHRSSWRTMGQALLAMAKVSFPLVETAEVQIIIATPEVGGVELIKSILDEDIRPEWRAYDAKLGVLDDDDVDTFYGCTLCQTFAPNHVCTITPQRNPYCGIVTYFGARAFCDIDPYGYTFKMPKGRCMDPIAGQYEGVNQVTFERSSRTVKKVNLYSAIKYPQTNCGCFEAAIFYIPEVDGLGMVDRRYGVETPIGITFSTMAGFMSGGHQNHGYMGCSYRTPRSKRFLQADGGWERVVWIPKEYKKLMADVIPEEIYDKLATEEDALNQKELKEFLVKVNHPIVEKFWKDGEPQPLTLPKPGEDWPEARE